MNKQSTPANDEPVPLHEFLAGILSGNIRTAEELEKLADKFIQLADRMKLVAYLMLGSLALFVVGSGFRLISDLIVIGVIR